MTQDMQTVSKIIPKMPRSMGFQKNIVPYAKTAGLVLMPTHVEPDAKITVNYLMETQDGINLMKAYRHMVKALSVQDAAFQIKGNEKLKFQRYNEMEV